MNLKVIELIKRLQNKHHAVSLHNQLQTDLMKYNLDLSDTEIQTVKQIQLLQKNYTDKDSHYQIFIELFNLQFITQINDILQKQSDQVQQIVKSQFNYNYQKIVDMHYDFIQYIRQFVESQSIQLYTSPQKTAFNKEMQSNLVDIVFMIVSNLAQLALHFTFDQQNNLIYLIYQLILQMDLLFYHKQNDQLAFNTYYYHNKEIYNSQHQLNNVNFISFVNNTLNSDFLESEYIEQFLDAKFLSDFIKTQYFDKNKQSSEMQLDKLNFEVSSEYAQIMNICSIIGDNFNIFSQLQQILNLITNYERFQCDYIKKQQLSSQIQVKQSISPIIFYMQQCQTEITLIFIEILNYCVPYIIYIFEFNCTVNYYQQTQFQSDDLVQAIKTYQHSRKKCINSTILSAIGHICQILTYMVNYGIIYCLDFSIFQNLMKQIFQIILQLNIVYILNNDFYNDISTLFNLMIEIVRYDENKISIQETIVDINIFLFDLTLNQLTFIANQTANDQVQLHKNQDFIFELIHLLQSIFVNIEDFLIQDQINIYQDQIIELIIFTSKLINQEVIVKKCNVEYTLQVIIFLVNLQNNKTQNDPSLKFIFHHKICECIVNLLNSRNKQIYDCIQIQNESFYQKQEDLNQYDNNQIIDLYLIQKEQVDIRCSHYCETNYMEYFKDLTYQFIIGQMLSEDQKNQVQWLNIDLLSILQGYSL